MTSTLSAGTPARYPRPTNRWWGWRGAMIPTVMLAGMASAVAQADIVRITSINGQYDPNHSQFVEVKPGDVVSLASDGFTEGTDGYQPQNRYVEDFYWSSDAKSGDECDAANGASCLGNTNFEVTDYGVNFYVPYDLTRDVTITVRGKTDWATDSVILRSAYQSQPDYTPPTQVITSPDQYSYNRFDPSLALAGQGRWVFVGGVRYWVPYSYRSDWVPYQNGYWSRADDDYTWISHDPWGWVTDHYGVWRHHRNFGWIWLPFADLRYRPHTVTWFHGDEYVGWYPYYDGYRDGYRHGYNEGFDDGYWQGYYAGRFYGGAGRFGYVPGFTAVRYGSFLSTNIWDVRAEWGMSVTWWQRSYSSSWYGAYPGGVSYSASRGWFESRIGGQIPHCGPRYYGSGVVFNPSPVYPVPPVYRGIHAGYGSVGFHRPVSVGAIYSMPRGAVGGAPTFIPPTTNGRGIAAPPHFMDPNRGYVPVPPRARMPGVANPQNPIYRPMPAPVAGPGMPGHVPPPVYHPGHPAPRPTFQPAPIPGPVGPRPAPTFNPGPAPAPRPQPTFNPGPRPTFGPQPGPVHPGPVNPGPRPTFGPQPGPRPQPTFNPGPRPTFGPQPGPVHPGPVNPGPRPTFGPQPGPRPQPTFNPGPRPTFGPQPGPVHPGPVNPGPRPTFGPQPGPRPQPTFNPGPRPQPPVFNPGPRPQPGPVTQPGPRPQPGPVIQPGPRPQPPVYNPGPAPAPRPQPTFNPGPRPQPPVYNPGPRPAPPSVSPGPRPAPAPVRPAPGPVRPPGGHGPRPR